MFAIKCTRLKDSALEYNFRSKTIEKIKNRINILSICFAEIIMLCMQKKNFNENTIQVKTHIVRVTFHVTL